MKRRQFLATTGSSVALLAGGCTSSGTQQTVSSPSTTDTPSAQPTETQTATPRAPVVGTTVSTDSGERVGVPFRVTATGTDRIGTDDPVVNVDLAYIPDLALADGADAAGTWSDGFEDQTAWTPASPIDPGETVEVRLPVAVADRARGLYTLRATRFDVDASGTARLRVASVPADPDVALTAYGGRGGLDTTGPPQSAVLDMAVCPDDAATAVFFLRNSSETPVEEATLDLTVPDGWRVHEASHADQWDAADTQWRVSDLAPGRYRWRRVDLAPPAKSSEQTPARIEASATTTTGATAVASATFEIVSDC